MDAVMLRAMSDELTKIAITIPQLGAAAARIPNVSRELPGSIKMFGGLTIPRPSQAKGPGAIALNEFQQKLVPREIIERIEPTMTELQRTAPGRIFVDPNVGHNMLHPGASPELSQNLHNFTVVHEGLERAQPRFAPGSMHGHPNVIVQDANMRNRLTGPGGAELQQSMNELRAPEDELLRQQMTAAFHDPRAAGFVQPGQRVPRAMRRAFARSAPQVTPEQGRTIGQQMGGTIMGRAFRDAEAEGRVNLATGMRRRPPSKITEERVAFEDLPVDIRAQMMGT